MLLLLNQGLSSSIEEVEQRHSEFLKLQKEFRGTLEKGFLHWVGSGEVTSELHLTPESVILRLMEPPFLRSPTFTLRPG